MMKKVFFIFLFGIFASCEEVVEIDLEESRPRLVVEASLLWDWEEENVQYVHLTTTAPYFDEEIPAAQGGEVSVYDDMGNEYPFNEVKDGIFRNSEIEPSPGKAYRLVVEYQDEIYEATAEFVATPKIKYVTQEENTGFSGEETELKLFYEDPANEDNYYLFRLFDEELSLQLYDDEFTDGNLTYAFFGSDELEPGDVVGLEIQGISQSFYQYLFILRSQAGTGGGPFQTQPTIVRGNIVNTTNPDNFAFGFFRLSETDFLRYEIE